MILKLLDEKKGFTTNEALLADYVLSHPFEISNLTASELGKKAFVSKSLIFRLCRKIGINSYDEFKRRIEIEMMERSRLQALLDREPFHKDTSLTEIINILPSIYDKAIHGTKISLNNEVLEEVIRKIKNCNQLDIYGSGITYSCALTATFKFQTIGINCFAHSGVNEHYIQSTQKNNTVALLLSFTGRNSSMQKIASYLSKNNGYIVGLGGTGSQKLKKLCNEYIDVPQNELILSMEILTSYIALNYVLDVIFSSILTKNFEQNISFSLDVKKSKMID